MQSRFESPGGYSRRTGPVSMSLGHAVFEHRGWGHPQPRQPGVDQTRVGPPVIDHRHPLAGFVPCGVWEAVYLIDSLLQNQSAAQPEQIHADTQGQSFPVFGLACLLGIDLLPRIRNFQDLTFHRPDPAVRYRHIDQLFSTDPRTAIDWDLIRRHWPDLMQVALSVEQGTVSSVTLLRRLNNRSRKNQIYQAFREVGRAVRTAVLLRYLSDPALREQIQRATNKAEAYNGFTKWLHFGNAGWLTSRDPELQDKAVKFLDLLPRV